MKNTQELKLNPLNWLFDVSWVEKEESLANKKDLLAHHKYDDFINSLITQKFKTIDEVVCLKNYTPVREFIKEEVVTSRVTTSYWGGVISYLDLYKFEILCGISGFILFGGCTYLVIKAVTKSAPHAEITPPVVAESSLATLVKGHAKMVCDQNNLYISVGDIRRSHNDLVTRVNLFTAPRVSEEARLQNLENSVQAQKEALTAQGEATHTCCTELHNDIGYVKSVVIKGHTNLLKTETRVERLEKQLGVDPSDMF